MRILCGVLTAFACGMLLFVIAASGGDLAMLSLPFTFYGGTGLVLLWLAGGQPSSFTTTAPSELATRQRRLRRAMRVAAGVFGVIMGWMLVGFGTTITWRAVVAIRTGTAEIGDVLTPVWFVLQALAAWVLVRFAFRGRPLPPTKPALTAATPSAGPSVTADGKKEAVIC